MILGIGTDIVEIERIEKAIKRNENFLLRNFSDDEYKYFESRKFRSETIAGAFSAKEAVSKSIGTGFRGFSLNDIEILRDELGKPYVILSEKLKGILTFMGINGYAFHLSIAHSKENAVAYVILEGNR